jgi:hypothetical protein
MKLIVTILALVITTQSFAHDHQEDRGRADRAEQNRRRHEEDRRRHDDGEIDIIDLSNTATLSMYTSEDNKAVAAQVINDSQEYMQSGNMSVLLNQKINELQKIDQNISLEEAIDLIVDSAKATL